MKKAMVFVCAALLSGAVYAEEVSVQEKRENDSTEIVMQDRCGGSDGMDSNKLEVCVDDRDTKGCDGICGGEPRDDK